MQSILNMLGGYIDFLICHGNETTFKTIFMGLFRRFNSLRGRITSFYRWSVVDYRQYIVEGVS